MSFSLDYKHQDASDLNLWLLQNEQLPAGICMLKEASIQAKDYAARIGIIGASHTTVIRNRTGVLREILACDDGNLTTPRSPYYKKPLNTIASIQPSPLRLEVPESHFNYHFSVTYTHWSETIGEEARILAGNRGNALHFDFPASAAGTPFTFVSWQQCDCGLSVYAIHAYPTDNVVAISRSHFILSKVACTVEHNPALMPASLLINC